MIKKFGQSDKEIKKLLRKEGGDADEEPILSRDEKPNFDEKLRKAKERYEKGK